MNERPSRRGERDTDGVHSFWYYAGIVRAFCCCCCLALRELEILLSVMTIWKIEMIKKKVIDNIIDVDDVGGDNYRSSKKINCI